MMLNHDLEAIIAQCTPKGSGALALIRISGINTIALISRMSILASGKSIADVPSHTIHYGSVIDAQKRIIDHVMFLVMYGPKTFTGQDTIEITCHNNPFIIEEIIQQAIMHGARLAHGGEFTKRAFLNGKIDLLQAESINDLIHASNQRALKQSLAQVDGSFSQWIIQIEKKLIKCLAFSEASFEFIDEEMEFGIQIREFITQILTDIIMVKKTFDQQQHIRQGIRIAIIGSVNAGKSSLFNALLNQKRAIVTEIAGTTRDSIEAGLYKNGNYWTLIDTAGLRQAEDSIEKQGIERSWHEAKKADVIILVYDGSRLMSDEERMVYQNLIDAYDKKIIIVHHKADLSEFQQKPLWSHPVIKVSSATTYNLDLVEKAVEEKIAALFEAIDSPFLLNHRQFNLLLELEKKLIEIQEMVSNTIEYELLSYHLNDALVRITELSGKTISEQGMDAVFREFCVGK